QTNGTLSVGVVGSYRISNDYSGRGGGSSSTHIKHFLIFVIFVDAPSGAPSLARPKGRLGGGTFRGAA
ncbi:MAG: hypothetical protein WAL36_17750, partial [Pseudolabrys sp.]